MSIEDQINSLSKNEMTVLHYKCKGLKYDQIKERLGYSKDWVQLHMSNAYIKLGFSKEMHWTKRRDILKNEVCPLLPKNIDNWQPVQKFTEEYREDIEDSKEEPVPDPEIMALVLYDEQQIEAEKEKSLVPPKPKEPIVIIKKEKEEEESKWIKIFRRFFFALVASVIISFLGILLYNFGRNSVLSVPPQIMIVTVTPLPVTDTPLPTATSAIPTDTPTTVPTNTQAPTITPIPTEFIPPADGILFQDNFDSGDLSAWTVVNGKWIVSDGQLTKLTDNNNGNDYQWISLVRPEWKNYLLSFDVSKPTNTAGAIAVRDSSSTQPIGVEIGRGDRINLVLISSNWVENTELSGRSDVSVPEGSSNIQLEVQGDTYILRLNNREIKRVTISGYDSGGISIGAYCSDSGYGCTKFDNIKVTYLP